MKVIDLDVAGNHCELSEEIAMATKSHRLPNNSAGFTLVELMVVMAILAVLAMLSVPVYESLVKNTRSSTTILEIRGIEKSIIASAADNQTFPADLASVDLGGMLDPWGNPYQYTKVPLREDFFSFKLNTEFDIYSRGPDGLTNVDITHVDSLDDIVRTGDGGWVGIASNF